MQHAMERLLDVITEQLNWAATPINNNRQDQPNPLAYNMPIYDEMPLNNWRVIRNNHQESRSVIFDREPPGGREQV